jgi:hypothetical protein
MWETIVSVIDWLLDSDPAIRWQVMRDLTDAPTNEVAAERAKVAREGWGARVLSLQGADGRWGGGAAIPDSTSTNHTLWLLRVMGLDPGSDQARRAVARVREVRWEYDESMRFFAGEVEPCINGTAVAVGAYFAEDVGGIVDRLLRDQMADGGWNCDQERGSTRGSFNSTICVLEGLREYERTTGGSPAVTAARARGQNYLLERRMLRRLSTGEVADPSWTHSTFPPGWHYDVLRGLDYLRDAGVTSDDRVAEAIALIEAKRDADGRWPLEAPHFASAHRLEGKVHFAMDDGVGKPSRWNTLRALRVLRWADPNSPAVSL